MNEAPRLPRDDRALLETLVGLMGARLLAYVRRARPGCDAEELVAETFARAARSVAALRAAPRPDLYLLRIARNLCRDEQRRRAPKLRTSEWLDNRSRPAPTPDSAAIAGETSAMLQREVDALPEAQREIIVLRYAVGLQFDEIAECLGIPLGTALSRAHAAVARLRSRLEGIHVAD